MILLPTTISFTKKPKLHNDVAFTGLPGIGLVGKIALDHLMKQLGAEKIATIYSDSFPPSVHTKDALLELIKDDVHVFNFKGRDFVFLTGPVQPTLDFGKGSVAEHYEFATAIVNAFKELGVSEVYTLAGINVGLKRMKSEPRVVIAATSKKVLDDWQSSGVVSDRTEGLVSGAAGLVLGLAKEHGMQGACLMGETNAQLLYGDPGAAKKIVELLVKRYGFKIDMSGIEKDAKGIEEAFSKLSEQIQEGEDAEPDNQHLTYVR